jgi:hypothetical protein
MTLQLTPLHCFKQWKFLQHCTPLYMSTVIARRLGVICCSTADLAEACLLASSTSANQEQPHPDG